MIPDWGFWLITLLVGVLFGTATWYFWDKGQRYYALYSAMAGMCLVVLAIGLMVRNDWIKKEIQSRTPVYFGELVPANEDPLPPHLGSQYLLINVGGRFTDLVAEREPSSPQTRKQSRTVNWDRK